MEPEEQGFTPDQINILRLQIVAFKLLAKGLTVPLEIREQLLPPCRENGIV